MKHKNTARRLIGLTGGISTGKTTVSNYLAEAYQLPVLDADIYAREAVKPNSPILQAIVARYGDRLILPDGNLNRSALGEIIFQDEREKKWLESKIHPYVRDRFVEQLQQLDSKIVVLAIPLIFEVKMTDFVTEIWVVYCDEQTQLERLQKRDNLTLEQARIRIANQLSLAEKVARADVVLDNNSDRSSLFAQIERAIKGKVDKD
ncbi:MAG: dephospho-CoA kinase [Xenococcaceae cyanobacterium MO_188.B32]|nr:dephospho-CoA kinase [Xenococcaceae cyanobacterium MO_188.B32]